MRDSEVVASIVAGDPAGLAIAYERYADPLYKYCQALLGDPADAADAVQDTFAIAASRLDGLRDPELLRAWLFAVARNEALRILRARAGTPAQAQPPPAAGDPARPGNETGRASLRTLTESAVGGLNPGERELSALQLGQGLTPAEVAAVLGVSRNHAQALLSGARDQLEDCLGALLVCHAGRQECAELGAVLAGWDGRLTTELRERVSGHIGRCATCGARRAAELSPARLSGMSPGAALAAGAAESFRLAAGTPGGLKAHTIELATGTGPDAAAHRAAVLGRAGAFPRQGFPRADDAARPGLSERHGGAGGTRRRLLGMSRGQAATAAVVLAAIITVAAFALTGTPAKVKLASAPPTANAAGQAPPAGGTSPAANAAPTAPGTAKGTTTGAATATGTAASAPVAASAAAGTTAATSAAPTGTALATPTLAPTPTPPGTSPTAGPTGPSPAPTTASPGTGTQSPPPTSSPAPGPTGTPAPPGTLSESPRGGTSQRPRPLLVVPGAGSAIRLVAYGGTVTYSVTIANDPHGAIGVSPSASGTLTPSDPAATVTITASQPVRCGRHSSASCPTVTISPGGAVYVIWTGRGRRAAANGHSQARHLNPAAPGGQGALAFRHGRHGNPGRGQPRQHDCAAHRDQGSRRLSPCRRSTPAQRQPRQRESKRSA